MNFIPLQVTFQSSKIKFYLCISSQLWLLSYHTVFIPYLELEIQKEFGKRDCRQWFSKSKESITYLEIFEICSWKKYYILFFWNWLFLKWCFFSFLDFLIIFWVMFSKFFLKFFLNLLRNFLRNFFRSSSNFWNLFRKHYYCLSTKYTPLVACAAYSAYIVCLILCVSFSIFMHIANVMLKPWFSLGCFGSRLLEVGWSPILC